MGETTLAWQIVRRSLPAGLETPPGSVRFLLAREIQLLAAALALDAGDFATARRWLDTHNRWQRWSGAVLGESEGQALWAQYHRQVRRHAKPANTPNAPSPMPPRRASPLLSLPPIGSSVNSVRSPVGTRMLLAISTYRSAWPTPAPRPTSGR